MKKILCSLVCFLLLIGTTVPAYASSLYDVSFWCTKKAVHIRNNSDLKDYLSDTSGGSLDVAKKVKLAYYNMYDKYLDITDMSLAVEILGHVYPEKIASYIPFGLGNKIIGHTSVIDCGERAVDGNRVIWDSIATVLEQFINNPVILISKGIDSEKDTLTNEQKIDNIIKDAKKQNANLQLDKKIMLKVLNDISNGSINKDLIKLAR